MCVFCKSTKDKVRLFTSDTLQKCINILKIRKENNLKFFDVILPSSVNTNEGYHTKCYSSFTALMNKYKKLSEISVESSSSASLSPQASTSTAKVTITADEGFSIDNIVHDDTEDENIVSECLVECQNVIQEIEANAKACIFCNFVRKKNKGRWQNVHSCENDSVLNNIISLATKRVDSSLLQKISKLKSENIKIEYHSICLHNYKNNENLPTDMNRTNWHIMRDIHKIVFQEICAFITENIITKSRNYFLQFLYTLYKDSLAKKCKKKGLQTDVSANLFTSQHLEQKILTTFNKKIKIIIMRNKKIVTSKRDNVALDEIEFQNIQNSDILQRAALLLRQDIMKIETNKFPEKLSEQHLINGECSIPSAINDFYVTLLSGCSRRRKRSSNCLRIAKSFSQDIIYAVRNGSVKTSKHVTLGMALKNLTSSRKVIDILNRYGHCCSYNVLEELETEATFSCSNRSDICPQDILQTRNLLTGIAFDNFDRFVDTSTGK